MSFLSTISHAVSQRGDVQDGCQGCLHFCTDPVRIETELPGLAALSSAHASVRARDGLCLFHDLVINGGRRCASFVVSAVQP